MPCEINPRNFEITRSRSKKDDSKSKQVWNIRSGSRNSHLACTKEKKNPLLQGEMCSTGRSKKSQKMWAPIQSNRMTGGICQQRFFLTVILIIAGITIMCICWALTACDGQSESDEQTEHLWLWPHWSPSRTVGPTPGWPSSSGLYPCPREEAKHTSEGRGQRDDWARAAWWQNEGTPRLDGPEFTNRRDSNWSLKSLGTDTCPLLSFFWKPQ